VKLFAFTDAAACSKPKCMTLWTRLGFLIPVLWLMGFVVFYWVNHFSSGFVPEKWIVTVGHLLGTIFVWIFSITIGQTTIKEMIDAETEESVIIEKPHKFLFFSAKMWGLILTVAVGWFLYQPPPKSWLDEAFLQKAVLEKQLSKATDEAKSAISGEPVMREWINAQGKKLKAKCIGREKADGKDQLIFEREDGTTVRYDFSKLSADDQAYVNSRFK
jgi:hypothetical protein